MRIGVSCETARVTEDGLDTRVCTEMIGVLKQTYPKVSFGLNQMDGQSSVKITIQSATHTHLALQLAWRLASGKISEGQLLSVVMMDKDLDSAHRNSLYRRLLNETQMPKQIGQE